MLHDTNISPMQQIPTMNEFQDLSDSKVDLELDSWIAERASMATNMAYRRAKAISCTVVVSKDGYIVAELPDGTERIIGISRRRKVQAGIPLSFSK